MKPTAELKVLPVSVLKPAAYNPRKKLKPGDKEYEKIKNSIEEFGFADPLVVNADMTIIGGHQRLTVAMSMGYTEVPCAVVDIDKTREKALNIALNKITGMWDDNLLADLIKELEDADFDVGKTGFEAPEIETLFNNVHSKTPVYASDVIVTYQVLPEKSAWIYANVSDIKNLIGEELVASAIKSAMVELTPGEVTARTKIEPLVQQKLSESLTQKYGEGVVFVNKVVINDMDFEEAYNAAIQQKSIAQQNADRQKIENAAAIAKAEADKQVAITNAEAEAQKTAIKAEAQAEANKKIAESLSDTLIEYQKIQKWDGKLPTVTGSTALVGIDAAE